MKLSQATCPKCKAKGTLAFSGKGRVEFVFDRGDCEWKGKVWKKIRFAKGFEFKLLMGEARYQGHASKIKCKCGFEVDPDDLTVFEAEPDDLAVSGYDAETTLNELLAELFLQQRFEALKKKHPKSLTENTCCPNCGERSIYSTQTLLRCDDPEAKEFNDFAVIKCQHRKCREAGVVLGNIGHAFANARLKTKLLAREWEKLRAESNAKLALQRKSS